MAERDPWEVYSAPPSSIAGPPKAADPIAVRSADRQDDEFDYRRSRDAEADRRAAVAASRLPSDKEGELRDAVSLVSNLQRARQTFNPDYLGLGSGLENFAQTYSPIDVGTPGQRDWWSAFKSTDNIERNKLFGASLSGGEKAAYGATTITPDMAPEQALKNIDRRYEIARGALSRYRDYLVKSGYSADAINTLVGGALTAPVSEGPATEFAKSDQQRGVVVFGDQDNSEDLIDPTQRAVSEELEKLFNAGEFSTPGEVLAYAKGRGITPPDMAAVEAAFAARAKGGAVSFAPVPRSRPEQVEQAAERTVGDTSYGTPLGIADAVPFAPQIGAALDTLGLTGGRPNVFNSDASLADLYGFNRDVNNRALDIAQDRAPVSYALGQAGTLIAGGAGAARAIPALGRYGAWAAEGGLGGQIAKAAPAEAAYGALYGAGRNPDDPVRGALNNSLAAAGGGALGRSAIGLVGSVIAPTGGALGKLYQEGVRPTIGQRVSKSNAAGRMVNGAEQALQSVPGFGYLVSGARQGARDEFERGGFNQALNKIGDELPNDMELGTAPHAYMQEAFERGYTETLPRMRAVADEAFEAGAATIAEQVAGGALDDAAANRFNRVIASSVSRRMVDGALSGEALKDAVSEVQKIVRNERSKANGDRDLASFLEDYVGELKGAAARHSDPEDVQRLSDLDAGYAIGVRLEDAARMRGGDPGRFSPTQLDASVQRNAGGIRSRSYLRGDALLQDYAEAGKSLVDTLPNSGTPERLLTYQALAGGPTAGALGMASPAALAGLGMATLPYAPVVRRGVQGLLAPRQSARLNTLGDVLRRNAALGAPLGAAGALPYVATANE